MKDLIKALKKAHAGELAAYFAYEGHWKSVADHEEQMRLLSIQMDEMKHILTIRKFLRILETDSNAWLDFIYICIGRTIGALCFVSSWRSAMFGAGLMERFGATKYRELALLAAEHDRFNMALVFQRMAKQEEEHERYFKERLGAGRRAS